MSRVILFCDLHNFSRLMLAIEGSVLGFIDIFYQRSGKCIVSRGGRIIKYIGDSMLATFPGIAQTMLLKRHAACGRNTPI